MKTLHKSMGWEEKCISIFFIWHSINVSVSPKKTYIFTDSGIIRCSIGINPLSSSKELTNFNFLENFELKMKKLILGLFGNSFQLCRLPYKWLAHDNQCFKPKCWMHQI